MIGEKKAQTLRETLIKRLTLSKRMYDSLLLESKTKLRELIQENGVEKFSQNPEWYIEIAVDAILAGWFRMKTSSLKEKVGYQEALLTREVQSVIDSINKKLTLELIEYSLAPGNLDQLKTRNLDNIQDDVHNLESDFENLFRKVSDSLNNLDTRLRALESKKSDSEED